MPAEERKTRVRARSGTHAQLLEKIFFKLLRDGIAGCQVAFRQGPAPDGSTSKIFMPVPLAAIQAPIGA